LAEKMAESAILPQFVTIDKVLSLLFYQFNICQPVPDIASIKANRPKNPGPPSAFNRFGRTPPSAGYLIPRFFRQNLPAF
jgi:hypothetical protein